jgi:hypothetical protein
VGFYNLGVQGFRGGTVSNATTFSAAATFNGGISLAANTIVTGSASPTNTAGIIWRSNTADGATSIGQQFDNTALITTSGGNYLAFSGANAIYGYVHAYSGGNTGLRLSAAGGGGVNEYMSIDGPITGFQVVIAGGSKFFMDSTHIYPAATTLNLGDSASYFGQVWTARYNGLSQSVAFSATPNFDPTSNGELIHFGPVTGNVTGATITSGTRGQRITINMLKDATAGTYTIAFSGTNVRATGGMAFTATASSIVSINFRWNDKLGTPAWVQESPPMAGV